MDKELEAFLNEITNDGKYVEIGFSQDVQSTKQLESMLRSIFMDKFLKKQEEINNKSSKKQAEELGKTINDKISNIGNGFEDKFGKTLKVLESTLGSGTSKFVKGLVEGGKLLINTAEFVYKNGAKLAQTLIDLDKSGIATSNGFEELLRNANLAGTGHEKLAKAAMNASKSIAKLSAAHGDGFKKFSEYMGQLTKDRRLNEAEAGHLINAYVKRMKDFEALKDPNFGANLEKFAHSSKILSLAFGETVESITALNEKKAENRATETFLNKNSKLKGFIGNKQIAPILENFGINNSVLLNELGGVKSVGVLDTLMVNMNSEAREILSILKERFQSGDYDETSFLKEIAPILERGKEKAYANSENPALMSVASHSPIHDQVFFSGGTDVASDTLSGVKQIDTATEIYDNLQNSTNEIKTGVNEFNAAVDNITTNVMYTLSGGSESFTAIQDSINKITTEAQTYAQTASSKVAEINEQLKNGTADYQDIIKTVTDSVGPMAQDLLKQIFNTVADQLKGGVGDGSIGLVEGYFGLKTLQMTGKGVKSLFGGGAKSSSSSGIKTKASGGKSNGIKTKGYSQDANGQWRKNGKFTSSKSVPKSVKAAHKAKVVGKGVSKGLGAAASVATIADAAMTLNDMRTQGVSRTVNESKESLSDAWSNVLDGSATMGDVFQAVDPVDIAAATGDYVGDKIGDAAYAVDKAYNKTKKAAKETWSGIKNRWKSFWGDETEPEEIKQLVPNTTQNLGIQLNNIPMSEETGQQLIQALKENKTALVNQTDTMESSRQNMNQHY